MNILLVEDDKMVRESMKLLLSIDRHNVTEAATGHEALALFTGMKYDLVITDYLMPDMRGDELATNIRNIAPSQPILIATGYAEPLAATHTTIAELLPKPVSIESLRQAILRATQGSKRSNRSPDSGRTDS